MIKHIGIGFWLLAIAVLFLGCEQNIRVKLVFKAAKQVRYDGLYVKPGWFSKIKPQSFRGKDVLVSFDNSNLILYFHDIDSLRQIHKINLSAACMTALGQTFQCYVDDKFILLLGYPGGSIAKLDLQGNWIATYQLPAHNFPPATNFLSALYGIGFSKFNNHFLLYAERYSEDSALHKIRNNCTVHFQLNDTDTCLALRDYSGWFPDGYDANQVALCSRPFAVVNGKHELIYAFPPEKNLYVYDTALVQRVVACQASVYETPNDTFDNSRYAKDWDYQARYVNKAGFYNGVFYDVYRRLYYRVYAHSRAENDPPADHKLEYYNRSFSVIIMDENFNKLGEHKFERNKYYFYQILPTPQGLLLPKIEADIDQPSAIADFDLFEVVMH